MKREIKFRVFFYDGVDYKTGEMLSGVEAFCENYIDWDDGELKPTDTCSILMQFTGLTDKNGKEIYEGDIVKGNRTKEGFFADGRFIQGFSGSGQICQRSFEYREVKFEITDRSISINLPKDITYSERTEPIHWEVVGNIYETPELLTK